MCMTCCWAGGDIATCFSADVDDCSNAATHLAEQKLADPKKLCITGGSAGGYTTLACLAFKYVAQDIQHATPDACWQWCASPLLHWLFPLHPAVTQAA
jgi:poly(3-hydroxybutyrate) depolymerase